jgi:hypothetical protein
MLTDSGLFALLLTTELLAQRHDGRHQKVDIDLLALFACNSYPPLLLRHVRPNASKVFARYQK